MAGAQGGAGKVKRGYACIGLDNPKTSSNLGSAMRAVGIYGASFLAYTGHRLKTKPTDVNKFYRHIPLLHVVNLRDIIPYDCVPIAVEIISGAVPLYEYEHPERAFYVFGAEDATLGNRVLSWCRDIVFIPTERCMNLAATVNVILYDRMAKENGEAEPVK